MGKLFFKLYLGKIVVISAKICADNLRKSASNSIENKSIY